MSSDDPDEIASRLAVPFDPAEVKFKPQHITGSRALVVSFIDARLVQDRLDEVLGVMGWRDSYEACPDGSVVCRLSLKIGGEWITKMDVGGQSEQPDEGDRKKAAFSDALKRAAVKFGIGRYLYALKPQWLDYDPQKRQVIGTPRLPGTAANPVVRTAPAKAPAVPQAASEPQKALPAPKEAAKAQEVCYRPTKQEAEWIGDWQRWLANGPELRDFNERLPGLATFSPQLKKIIWLLILEHASEVGWEFDKKKSAFVHKGAA